MLKFSETHLGFFNHQRLIQIIKFHKHLPGRAASLRGLPGLGGVSRCRTPSAGIGEGPSKPGQVGHSTAFTENDPSILVRGLI